MISLEELRDIGVRWQRLMDATFNDQFELWERLVEGKRGIGGYVLVNYGEEQFHEWEDAVDEARSRKKDSTNG